MAELLRSGHTMLNIACPVCNNPIFRNKEGEKFCPSCNRKVIIVNDQKTHNSENTELNFENNRISENISNKDVLSSLRNVILKKMQLIMNKLTNETHVELIRDYTETLSKLYDLFNKITFSLNQ